MKLYLPSVILCIDYTKIFEDSHKLEDWTQFQLIMASWRHMAR